MFTPYVWRTGRDQPFSFLYFLAIIGGSILVRRPWAWPGGLSP